ncbi:hypothetical protein QTO30_12635 [Yoonia sp. GPGPB17]|uniref:hypothetical protein n=1 Tax=Yoonia sp. GPGPB17 TaxID=3026147 RepID=UPI0030C0B913
MTNINRAGADADILTSIEDYFLRPFMKFIPLFAVLVLAACAQEGQYPITGEECGPNDPVLTLDAADCGVPALG